MPKAAKKEQTVGTFFPVDPKGARSTTWAGKEVIAAAFHGAKDPYSAEHLIKSSNSKWRFGYNSIYLNLVESSCKSPEASIGSARAGLDWMYNNFMHVNSEGDEPKNFHTMVKDSKTSSLIYGTKTIKGTKSQKKYTFEVPYDGGWSPARPKAPPSSAMKSKQDLKDLSNKWVKNGIIEPDAASAISWSVDYFENGGDLSNCYFVLIGAGSAMGPYAKLLELGANVVAIDIPGKWGERAEGLWSRLIGMAKDSSGTLTFPVDLNNKDSDSNLEKFAGCDLTAKPSDIANWLVQWQSSLPKDAKVSIGNYTYLDGDLHVKLALCADVCIEALRQVRPSTMLAFLCTPTDIHVTTKEAHFASKRNEQSFHKGYLFEKLIRLITLNKTLTPNVLKPVPTEPKKDPLYLVDGLSVAQGPNYALAKRMQHWRAMIAYEEGQTVSTSIAPSTATLSVIHNKTFAWAYGGMPHFKFEIFKQETTNAVMTSLLVHDLLNEKGPKNPKNREQFNVTNTLQLFSSQSVHGGLWHCPYKVDSIGEISAVIYFLGGPKYFLYVLMLIIGAIGILIKSSF